jgi:hypothetical protein
VSAPEGAYEAPAVEERARIDAPLVGTGSGASLSAVFRPV